MKYPKPGYNNPLVSVHVFDLEQHLATGASTDSSGKEATYELYWPDRHPIDNSIIMEVAWVTNASLILKEVNRNADDGNVVLFDLDNTDAQTRARGTVVRKLGKKGEQSDNGWIDNVRSPVSPGHV
jgi:dipeptidyl aminopeptidase